MSRSGPPSNNAGQRKPTWLLLARPAHMDHEEWRAMKLSARSVLQGEAMLRRLGYDVRINEAVRVDDPPDELLPAAPRPLCCSGCGYPLDSLRLEGAIVKCTECGRTNILQVWLPEPERKLTFRRALVVFLAAVGAVVVGFFVLATLFAVLSILFFS